MPQCTGHARARRKKLFARISSTFIKNKPHSNSSILESGKMLHSKSTYFYRWGSRASEDDGSSAHNSANRLWCASAHCEQATSCKESARANRTRRSLEKSLYSGMTERKGLACSLSYLVPSVCGLALLIGGIVAINPDINQVYADGEEDGASTRAADSSIALAFDSTPSFTEEVTADEVAYITNTFTVTAKKQAKFTLQMTAMNGSGTNLHGKENTAATIGGVGENVAPASFGDNTWGYALSPNISGDQLTTAQGLTYSSMPAYGTPKNMITENLTGAESESKTYLLAFAAKIGSDSPADHYIGNFLLSVLGDQFDPATYALTYDGNGGTGVPSSQSCVQASVGATCNITVAAGTPSRDGFSFLGWGNNPTDITANPAYSAGSTITMSANKTIYAVWKQDATFITITTMQEMTKDICTNAIPGQETKLRDTRDDKIYYVARLADGNCWMTQNLAYDKGFKQCDLDGGVVCSGWPKKNDGVARYAKGAHTDGNHASQGNFYSWEAAMDDKAEASEPIQGICPAGWQLPISEGEDLKSFANLMSAYGISGNTNYDKLFSEPLYFQYGGFTSDNKLYFAGSMGRYWSSTLYGDDRACNLSFSNGSVTQPGFNARYDGYSVRCVANEEVK